MPLLHPWDLSPAAAIPLQKDLRAQVRLESLPSAPRLIAGADVSMNWHSNVVFAGFVVLAFPELAVVDRAAVRAEAPFPYIPGLLSFREILSLLQAYERLRTKPDLIMVDGIGIAHPRRLGIASHLGLVLDVPTIGCGKSILSGTCDEPALEPGSTAPLYASVARDEVLGMAVRTKTRAKPMFISPGHRITLDESVRLVLACARGYRLPEPTRQAHLFTNEERRAYHRMDGGSS